MSKWSVHCCIFDANCRAFGCKSRVHVNTPWGHLLVAFKKEDYVYDNGPIVWTRN